MPAIDGASKIFSLLPGPVLDAYKEKLSKIEEDYASKLVRIESIGQKDNFSEERLSFFTKRLQRLTAILDSVLKQLPVSYIAIDNNGNIIQPMFKEPEEQVDGTACHYNAFSWDKIWELYDSSGNKLNIDQFPAIRSLCGEEVAPDIYLVVNKKTGNKTRQMIWSEPLYSGDEQVGSSIFFRVVEGAEDG